LRISYVLIPEIIEAIENKDFKSLKALVQNLHPFDIAEIVEDLEPNKAVLILRLLDSEKCSDVLTYLEGDKLEEIIKSFSDKQILELFEEIDDDDKVALFEELPPYLVQRIISILPKEEKEVALKLLNYPENSCGRIMNTDFVSIEENLNIFQAIEIIKKSDVSDEALVSIFVVTKEGKLKGYVKITKLVRSDFNIKLFEICESIASVSAYDDKETAAKIMKNYDLLVLPVVDKENRILGVITIDDIVDIIEEEATEDIYRFVGLIDPEARYFDLSYKEKILKRLPAIILMVILGNISGFVLNSYEKIIAHLTILTFFLPNLANTTGIIGSQASAFTIRAIATGEIERNLKTFLKLFFKEFSTIFIISIIIALGMFIIALFRGDFYIKLALVVSLTSIASSIIANTFGFLTPLILRKMNIDPAGTDIPLITTIGDALTYFTYFTLARIILF
jgi:magnesium transporter